MNVDFQIIYSQRKTVSLSVERDASIIVRAPEGTPEEAIHRAVKAKKLWLYEKVQHKQKYPHHKQRKEFVSGESILYLGRNYRLEVKDEDIPGVVFRSRFVISRKNQPQAAQLFRSWYTERAHERLPRRAKDFADALGVYFNRVLVSDLKVRWGSCTPKSNLNFNWRIMKAPTSIIDYLIVHELAHLIEPNHTPRFWNIIAVQVPQVAWAKQWLREHGELLEIDF
jgi:predicted metal-dependent hydrolase